MYYDICLISEGYIIRFVYEFSSNVNLFYRKGSVEGKEEEGEKKMEANTSLTTASEAADKRRFLLR